MIQEHAKVPCRYNRPSSLLSVQAKLPSFSENFTASVPLTRIRDIAHRNDIPSDLKREIKHTLQNKLHRNAGPEDLVATEAMLERITAPGTDYSTAFVHEFRVFTDELRDFFNAGSLLKILDGVRPALDDSAQSTLQHFVKAKEDMEASGSPDSIADCLHHLTSVRLLFISTRKSLLSQLAYHLFLDLGSLSALTWSATVKANSPRTALARGCTPASCCLQWYPLQ